VFEGLEKEEREENGPTIKGEEQTKIWAFCAVYASLFDK